MLWVAITGNIGSGKSTLCQILEAKGYPVLYADKIVEHIYTSNLDFHQWLEKTWGIRAEDSLSRKRVVRQFLLKHPHQKKTLEEKIHPMVRSEVEVFKRNNLHCDIAFYEIPLLFENNLQDQFDASILLVSDHVILQKRLKIRDGMEDDEIQKRMSWFLSNEEKLNKATYVIHNNDDLDGLKQQIELILPKIIQRGKSSY